MPSASSKQAFSQFGLQGDLADQEQDQLDILNESFEADPTWSGQVELRSSLLHESEIMTLSIPCVVKHSHLGLLRAASPVKGLPVQMQAD